MSVIALGAMVADLLRQSTPLPNLEFRAVLSLGPIQPKRDQSKRYHQYR